MENSNIINMGIEQKYRRSVCIGNQVLNGVFTMSLREYKLLYGAIHQIQAGSDFTQVQKLSKTDLKKFMGIEEQSDDLLWNIIKKFRRRELSFENETIRYLSSWVWKAEFHKGDDYVEILFNPDLVPQLINIKNGFTKCEIATLSGAKCTYTERLYPMLKQYQKLGVRRMMIDDMVKEFILPQSYLSNGNFNRYVIKPAIDEINRISDIRVKTRYVKDGRRIIGFEFRISEKTKEKETITTTAKEAVKDSVQKAMFDWSEDIQMALVKTLQFPDEDTAQFEKRLETALDYCKNYSGKINDKPAFFYSAVKKSYQLNGIEQNMFIEEVKKEKTEAQDFCKTCPHYGDSDVFCVQDGIESYVDENNKQKTRRCRYLPN